MEPSWPDLVDPRTSTLLVGWAKALNASSGLLNTSFLVACAAALGLRVKIQVGSLWREPSLMWAVCVAPSGSRKSATISSVVTLLKTLEQRERTDWRLEANAGLETRKFIEAQWAAHDKRSNRAIAIGEDAPPPPQRRPDDIKLPTEPHLIVDDVTPAALLEACADSERGVLLRIDEAPRIFDLLSSARTRALFLEGYNGSSYTAERVLKSNVRAVDRFGFSMVTGLQDDRMKHLPIGTNDGLFARFLWVSQTKRLPVAIARDPLDLKMPQDILQRLRAFGDVPGERVLTASDPFIALIEASISRWTSVGRKSGGLMQSWYDRAGGHCVRLALVLHALRAAADNKPLPESVSRDTGKLAVDLIDNVFAPQARHALSLHGLTRELGSRHALIIFLHANGTIRFNRRALRRANIGLFGDVKSFNEAVDDLVLQGLLRQDQPEDGKVGRKSGDYLVNPRLLRLGK
jgi:hypothetical protein